MEEIEEFILRGAPSPAPIGPRHNVHDWVLMTQDGKRYRTTATTAHAARQKGERKGLVVVKVSPASPVPDPNMRDPMAERA